MDPNILLALAAILVVVGLAGTVLPVLPGVLIVFGGLFLAAWAEDFARVGAAGLTIIGILAALAFAADFVASLLGARRVGATICTILMRAFYLNEIRHAVSAPGPARACG